VNEKINFKENEFGYIEYKSKNPYEFYQIFNELDEAETQDSFGWLIFPEQGKKPYPVVVCAHGSDNWAGHHHEHILNFLNNGIAVFKAHSFDSRGVASTVEDQLSVTTAMMMVDVVEPLKFLSRHPDIDANKIAITGWSLGGMVAFYAAWEPIMEKLAPNGERFCAHLPFYPPTFLNPDEHRWSKAPILNLIGSDDDYTPFDSIHPVTFWPEALAINEKFAQLKNDGSITFTTDEGKAMSANSFEDRVKIFETGEIKFGAHSGGDWSIRRDAMDQALSFMKKHLL
jgi:dienelactone hydrolase